MLAEIGLFLLLLALGTSSLQSAYLLPNRRMQAWLGYCLPHASWLQALCITLAFCVLISLRLNSDFTVVNVLTHSNLALPVLYKISGTWGNHEGSMLLWVWVLALFGLALANTRVVQNSGLKQLALAVQSAICAGFLLFILCTSNPFERRFPPVVDGQALNPLLQDIGLAIHPPLLYLGYVGFSIVFSLGVAALIQGRMDKSWATLAHPWIMASWSALTLGIGLGSWWAYRELGWGGWWFWDPVENASLLPWLCGTALLHANIVCKKRGLLKPWVLLLAILTFGLSLLGTFLVRSGVLTSVHSFANDPLRGLFILGYITAVIGGALLVYALRITRVEAPARMLPATREGMIVINNLFLLTACATVLLGTLYPVIGEWLGAKQVTVGPPYFNKVFLPLMAVPLFFAGLAPLLPWKKSRFVHHARQCWPAAMAAGAALVLALAVSHQRQLLALAGFSLAAWLGAASVQYIIRSHGRMVAWPVFVGHLGAAVLILGITGSEIGKQEVDRLVKPGDRVAIAEYQLMFEKQTMIETANYQAKRAQFTLSDANGKTLATLAPEFRTYSIGHTTTSEAAIYYDGWNDVYAVVGESSENGASSARFYYTPMIGLIWLGFVLMALAGCLSIIILKRNRYARADI